MSWSPLGTQFCLELAFGTLLAMAFVPRAPVGVLFYRIMGTTALLLLLVALAAPIYAGQTTWGSMQSIAIAAGVLAFPVYSGPVRGARWALGLGVALLGSAVALVGLLAEVLTVEGPLGLLLASATSLTTGTVTGSVGLAMVLGHWYLTIPNLSIDHLRRLNRVCVVSMLVSVTLLVVSCLTFGAGSEAAAALWRPMGLFFLATRLSVGLLLPLIFAWMTSSSLRYGNTRSATGILYASTVLVLIGAAVSVALQDSYGIPL